MSLANEQLLLPAPSPRTAPARERILRPLEQPQVRRRPKLAYAMVALAGYLADWVEALTLDSPDCTTDFLTGCFTPKPERIRNTFHT